MSETTLKTRFKLNSKTESEWASNSTFVPLKGEPCLYSDLRKVKIGDGTTTIVNLQFANLTPEEIQELIQTATDEVNTKIDNLEIDGRNLILNSSFSGYTSNSLCTYDNDVVTFSRDEIGYTQGEIISCSLKMSDYFYANARGKTITISADYYVEEPITYGTTAAWIGIELTLVRDETTGGSTQWLDWYGVKSFPKNVTDKWIRYSVTFDASDYDISSVSGANIMMRDASGTFKIRHPKIEFGNRATNWSPAPEDVDNKIDALSSNVQTQLDNKAALSHTHNYAGSSSAGGSANSAVKLETARTIALGTGVTGTATSFNGTSNIIIPVTEIKESYLSWGGKNISGDYSPLDAAMISDLGANRLAFGKAAGITIEYSRDAGTTWVDYGATDSEKAALLSTGSSFLIGKADSDNKATSDYMLRITLEPKKLVVYTRLNKFAIYIATNGSSGSYCSIDASLASTPITFVNFANQVPINGWSGWNIINTNYMTTYGNDAANQYGLIRFTFGCTGGSTTYNGLMVQKIMGFGGVGWTTPSNMASTGHIYKYDYNQNVTFPAMVTATSFSGNATSATKLETAHTIQTNLGSTSSASFDGTANVTPGITGTLPITNGGTGATTAAGVLTNLGITATASELNHVDGVTSNIQSQLDELSTYLDSKQDAITLTANRALISNSSGKVAVSAVTATELGYLDGVTSNVQTQLNAKAPIVSPSFTGNVTATGSITGTDLNATNITTSTTMTMGNFVFTYDSTNERLVISHA